MRTNHFFDTAGVVNYSATKGFTLIEMMVTVAIIAILAAVALPSYTDYVIRSKIPDATSGLATKRVRLETFYDNNRTYVNAGDCANDTTTSQYFDFRCTADPATTANTYTLEAVGKGSMAGFTYRINQSNVKSTPSVPAGWTSSASCWVVRKDGSC